MSKSNSDQVESTAHDQNSRQHEWAELGQSLAQATLE